MTADPQRVQDLFLRLVRIPGADRPAELERECGSDRELRQRVSALLRAHDEPDSYLDVPSDDLAATLDSQPTGADSAATGEHMPGASGSQDAELSGTLTSDHRRHALAGAVIGGRYTLQEKIGEGGMGEVWVAKQTVPVKRKVALKLIKSGMDSRAVLQRFEQERQALALMDHPHIARVLDGGMTPSGQPFFVMELVNGLPLARFCDELKLTPRERLELFVPICQAVQHAHQKGIIHRDLKPANILVTMIDGKPVPKVIDFGVAKATSGKLTEETMSTGFGAVVGTLEYMSPEQAGFGGDDIDTRADIYSLGVILYELLTGLRPIDAKRLRKAALTEMIRMIQEDEPSKPSTRLSTDDGLPSLAALRQTEPRKLTALLKDELDWVVMKCLEKQRERRYETANALSRDILRYLADEPVEARPPTAGYRFGKFLRRHQGPVLGASLVALALIGGLLGTAFGYVRAENARVREAFERAKAVKLAEKNAALALAERQAKEQATRLAEVNAELAEHERDAKVRATKLAATNAKLAQDERAAKVEAREATQEKVRQLARTKAVLFTSQLNRAAQVQEKDPNRALELLHDTEACPLDLRDMAWSFAEHACKRRVVGSFSASFGGRQALSPDGKLLALANSTRNPVTRAALVQVAVLEIPSGKVRATLTGFSADVTLMAFNADGSRLAVVADGTFSDTPAPRKQGELEAARPVPGNVQIWDVAAAMKVATLQGHADRILAMDISHDGSLLVTGSLDKTARLWELQTAKELHAFKEHGQVVTAVAFSPDGSRIATGGSDNKLMLWNRDDFELQSAWTSASNPDPQLTTTKKQTAQGMAPIGPVVPYAPTSDAIVALDFSADGNSLASASSNWLIEVRDLPTGQVRTTLREIKSPVRWVRFHRTGTSLLVQPAGGSMAQWDLATGQQLFTASSANRPIQGEFCKEHSMAALPVGLRWDILDLDAPVERAKFVTETVRGNGSVAVFSRDGETLATGCGDRIFLWDVRTGELRKTLLGHKNFVSALAFSPDGRSLASSSSLFNSATPSQEAPEVDDVRLWDVATGESLDNIPLGATHTPSLAFSPDGARLATLHVTRQEDASPSPVVSLWDMKTRELLFTLEPPRASFGLFGRERAQVAFNPTDGTLVSSTGRSLCIWNLEKRELQKELLVGSVGPLAAASSEFVSMAISPDGKSIATVNVALPMGAEFNIWSASTGELLKKVRTASLPSVIFSPQGMNLLSVSGTTVQIWDALTMQQRASFEVHRRTGLIGLAVSPDGQTLATAVIPHDSRVVNVLVEGPAEIKLWDVSRSPSLMTFQGQSTASFSPDNKTLIETDRGGAIRLWDLDSGRVRSSFDTTQRKIGSVFSPDGRFLAGGDVLGTAQDKLRLMARDADSKVADVTALLTLLDTQTGEFREIPVGKGPIQTPVFSPDGQRLVLTHDTSMGDGQTLERSLSVEIWNLAAGKAEATFPIPQVSISGTAAFSSDGKIVALPVQEGGSQGTAGQILLIDLARNALLPSLKTEGSNFTRRIRFANDDTRLVVAVGNRDLRSATLWDWRAGKLVDEPVPDVFGNPNVSPDGRYELQQLPHGLELIDRTVRRPQVVSSRNR